MSEETVNSGPRLVDHLHGPVDVIRLDYDARLVRRKRLVTEGGRAVLLDLPDLTDLSHHAGLILPDGSEIALEAAPEPVLVIRGDLPRLAWHIGNRHTPCQMAEDHLIIRSDHVLRGMLAGLGAEITEATRPFHPEGGAYGHGRTMGHDHGHDH
ncbi:urease accessory protein UreE [Jannaschia sp. M317]|uniref:urease accessory protein UreE n=1 Tax=Jannaschia sp. M317 TaxID=2867011 RepID=UPI0021A5AB20|nr:urease accessory protein UreE [Jannaschia sp. M317]UWQ16940.1 urease accessory protein UreE [Jannaschia sp. M317]